MGCLIFNNCIRWPIACRLQNGIASRSPKVVGDNAKTSIPVSILHSAPFTLPTLRFLGSTPFLPIQFGRKMLPMQYKQNNGYQVPSGSVPLLDVCTTVQFCLFGLLPKLLLGFLLLCSCDHAFAEQGPSNSIPILTVCEALQNRVRYNGKPIIVIGRTVRTMEGSWLSEECNTKISTDGVVWGGNISLTVYLERTDPPPNLPKDFRWDDRTLLKKLKSLGDYSHYQSFFTNWAAVFGRFETRISPEYFRDANGHLRGLGFGHLSGSLAQLISGSDGFHELKEKEFGFVRENNDSPDRVE